MFQVNEAGCALEHGFQLKSVDVMKVRKMFKSNHKDHHTLILTANAYELSKNCDVLMLRARES